MAHDAPTPGDRLPDDHDGHTINLGPVTVDPQTEEEA